jgi:hypothetical protein
LNTRHFREYPADYPVLHTPHARFAGRAVVVVTGQMQQTVDGQKKYFFFDGFIKIIFVGTLCGRLPDIYEYIAFDIAGGGVIVVVKSYDVGRSGAGKIFAIQPPRPDVVDEDKTYRARSRREKLARGPQQQQSQNRGEPAREARFAVGGMGGFVDN